MPDLAPNKMDTFRAARFPALAVYIICVFAGTFHGFLVMIGWTALGLAFISWYVTPDRPKQNPKVWVLLGVIVFSHLMAIPGSVWFGTGNWVLTASGVYWLVPGLVVFLIADARVFQWLVAITVIHATSIFVETWWYWGYIDMKPGAVADGLTFNPNVAAGFLIIGISMVFATRRYWWTLFPLIIGLVFANSRGALLVLCIVMVLLTLTRTLSLRRLIVVCVVIGIGTGIFGILHQQYHIAGYTSFSTDIFGAVIRDIGIRWAVPEWPDIYPHGVVEHLGLHNVPIRMAREAGIASAAGWLVLSAWALTRNRYTPAWWLMLVIMLLSILDHYMWRVHLGSLWFLAAGILLVSHPSTQPTPSCVVNLVAPGLTPFLPPKHRLWRGDGPAQRYK